MDKQFYTLKELNSWYSVTTGDYRTVTDIIVLNSTPESIETPYFFTRYPSFCYIEQMRDYGIKHSPAHAYIQLLNILKNNYGLLKVTASGLGLSYVNRDAQTSTSFSSLRRRTDFKVAGYY